MGRPPKPGQARPPKEHPQGRKLTAWQKPVSIRLTERGWKILVAERKALLEQVEAGVLAPTEASFSVVVERALESHASRALTTEGQAEDAAFMRRIRARWYLDAPDEEPASTKPAQSTDVRALVRSELAKALQSELPGILQALAGQAAPAPVKKPRKK